MYDTIETFIAGKTKMMFKRDYMEMSKTLTVNLESAQPRRYITGEWNGAHCDGDAICGHLHWHCDHTGDYTCLCCGLSTVNITLMCSCCASSDNNKELICGHVCKYKTRV
jgi:hypothetical protein